MLKKNLRGVHEESVPTLGFTKDSKIMLTGCTMGNIRMFVCDDFEGNLNNHDTRREIALN